MTNKEALILIVEDNDSLRVGMSEMLTLEGFRVLSASNGVEALRVLREATPELILSDVMMPEMDGFDFYNLVRARPDLISIPFIFLSARTDPADTLIGRRLGADDYLAKPVTREELVTAIRSRLERTAQIKFAQIRQAYQSSLTILADAIESRNPTSAGHIDRVTEHAVMLAQYLDWNERALNQLRFGAILHDIGKLNIPEEILFKLEPLTAEEWTVIRRHPVAGAEMVRGIPFLSEVVPLIRHHHERWDGTGYPDQLAGPIIPHGARIIALTDAFDAMLLASVYRPARSLDQAKDEIVRNSGSQFDPRIVDCFICAWNESKILQIYPHSA